MSNTGRLTIRKRTFLKELWSATGFIANTLVTIWGVISILAVIILAIVFSTPPFT